MAFDFKKEYRDLYQPKAEPSIIEVPPVRFLTVEGAGDPNEAGGAYQHALELLYGIAYTLKMSYKTDHVIDGFYQYVVPPLEGFWWQPGVHGVDYADKSSFHWVSAIRVPDFVGDEDFAWAIEAATVKKELDFSPVRLVEIDEGLCVQCMHFGPYDNEPATVAAMHELADMAVLVGRAHPAGSHDLAFDGRDHGAIVRERAKVLEGRAAFLIVVDNRARHLALEAIRHEYRLVEEVLEKWSLVRFHAPDFAIHAQPLFQDG